MPLLSNRWYEQLALFEVHKSNDFYCILVFYPKKSFSSKCLQLRICGGKSICWCSSKCWKQTDLGIFVWFRCPFWFFPFWNNMTLVFTFDSNCKSFPPFFNCWKQSWPWPLYLFGFNFQFCASWRDHWKWKCALISGPALLLKFEIFGWGQFSHQIIYDFVLIIAKSFCVMCK